MSLIDMEMKYALPDRTWSQVIPVQIPPQEPGEEDKAYHKRMNRFLRQHHPEMCGSIAWIILEPGSWKTS